MTKIKLRALLRGEHVHCTVFMSVPGQGYANLGTLIMRVAEYQAFAAAFYAARDAWSAGTFRVTEEGDALSTDGTGRLAFPGEVRHV